MTIAERILKILMDESCWLTFDELYCKAQPDCDWIEFIRVLESLVARGKVRYVLPYGADVGYYGIGEL